jgi:hypothetical protein
MAYSFFPNDFNNVPNLQDQLFLMKQKQAAQRLLENADSTPDNFDGPDAGNQGSSAEVAAGAQAMHDALVHTAALSWGYTHPHMRGTTEQTPHQRSMYHIIDTLNAHPSAPFKTAEEVVGAMRPFAIEGNSSLQDHTQEQMGLDSGFSGLMDRDDYEDHVMDAEEEAAATLANNVQRHVNSGNIFKADPRR